MQIGDICHSKTASGNSQRRTLRPLEPAPLSVHKQWRLDGASVVEYRVANCLVGR